MNKVNWISVLLDGSVPEKQIFSLLDLSFDLDRRQKTGGRSRTGSCTWVILQIPRYYDLEEAFGERYHNLETGAGHSGRGHDADLYGRAGFFYFIYVPCAETDIPYSFDDGKVRMDHIMRLKL